MRRGALTAFSADVLRGMHGTKAYIYAFIALLWSWAIGLGPIAIGLYIAMQGEVWRGILIAILLYVAFGLFMGIWPLLMLGSFVYGWYHADFITGIVNAVGYLLILAFVAAPEWFMALANREAQKADALQSQGTLSPDQSQKTLMNDFAERHTLIGPTHPPAEREKLDLAKTWLSMFGGKSNTEEVLRQKAEALAQLAIADGDGGRELISKLGNVPQDGQQGDHGFNETVMLTLHFADRMSYQLLPEPQRIFFTDALLESTLVALANKSNVPVESAGFEELSKGFITTFNVRQDEYGNYRIMDDGKGAKDTLFWEFGKKFAHALGSDMDVAIIIPVERYAVEMMVGLHLKELLLGRSE